MSKKFFWNTYDSNGGLTMVTYTIDGTKCTVPIECDLKDAVVNDIRVLLDHYPKRPDWWR